MDSFFEQNISMDEDCLAELLKKAREQKNSKLAWRPFRISVDELLFLVNEGGELTGYFNLSGKQSILVRYDDLDFLAESPQLLIFNDPDNALISSRFIN